MKEDHPRATSNYMVRNNVTIKKLRDPDLKWDKHTIRDIHQTIRQTIRMYDFWIYESNRLLRVRRKVRRIKKKKRVDFTKKKFKYGLEEPQNVKRALYIDTKRRYTKWCDSMALEVDSIIKLDCLEFKPDGTKPMSGEYQSTQLHCVFSIKHDLR